MKNNFILLELNHRNEIRADVNMTIKSLNITKIGHINVKIDTGCPYTSIPVRKLGISNEKARLMKQADCADPLIRKEISCGNILIGMDILSQMDIHIGKSKTLGKTVFLACPYASMNTDYLHALNEHFNL